MCYERKREEKRNKGLEWMEYNVLKTKQTKTTINISVRLEYRVARDLRQERGKRIKSGRVLSND